MGSTKSFDTRNRVQTQLQPNQQEVELIIGYLKDFGLNEKEARVYLALSKMSSATGSETALATRLSSLQTYRALRVLLNHGLVEMSLDRPRRYTPLKIEQAISLLGQEAERRLLDLESKTPLLLKAWAELGNLEPDRENFTFRIIQGNKNVSKFRLMLYQSAKNDVAAIMKPNELAKMVLDGADDVFQQLSFKNIAVRGLSELNRYNIDASKKFLEFIKFHHVNHSNLVPFVIIDGKEALCCLSRDGKDGIPENAIWTNHPELVGIFKEVFEELWFSSQEGTARVREIEGNYH